MDKLDRVFALHDPLGARHTAIPLEGIAGRLECAPATAKRAIRFLRERFHAPIEWDRARGGYRYAHREGEGRFELPGLWFGADEIAALLTLREVLLRMEPGLLGESLEPLSRRLEELLSRNRLGLREAARPIRVLSQHARAPGPPDLRRREDLRTPDPRRARGGRPRARSRRPLPDAYGIFAGRATETAMLRVDPRLPALLSKTQSDALRKRRDDLDGDVTVRIPRAARFDHDATCRIDRHAKCAVRF